MGKVISIHSSRGGTGKSLIAVNLAVTLAQRGRSVILFDLDFRAPSLYTILKIDYRLVHYWMNDYLDGRCPIDSVLRDLTKQYGTKGRFLAGLANPSIEAIREIMGKDRRWEMHALRRLLNLRDTLIEEKGVDYVIYDTSPGIQYSSVNAVVSSDLSIIVATMDILDIEGTKRIVNDIYDAFEKESVLLMNKVPVELVRSEEDRKKTIEFLRETFNRPVIAIIPCYCEVLRASRASIFVLDYPDHPFTRKVEEIAEKLEHL